MINFRTIALLALLITFAGCSDKKIFSGTSCSIDGVNGSGDLIVATKGDQLVSMAGWAADSLSKQAPENITINLVSSTGVVSKFADGKITVARPDVNAVLNAPSIVNAGFGLSAKVESLALGIYEIHILQHFTDRTLVCKSAKSIRID